MALGKTLYFVCVRTNSAQRISSCPSISRTTQFAQSVVYLGQQKEEKTYFTCFATNSAQRISSFLPIDFSNSSVCSIRRIPWAAKRRKNLLHLRCHKLSPEDIQLLARRFFEQLSLLNPSYAVGTKNKKKPTSPALPQTQPRGHPASCPSTFRTTQFAQSVICLGHQKEEKTYFTCVATNSAQRTSSFLPVDFSKSSSEYARVFIALSSVRTKPWSYLCVK